MPSDVLQALLGLIASGAHSYTQEKSAQSAEATKAAEAAKERTSKEKISTQEWQARTDIANKQILGSKEETVLKLQADKENLHEQLKANLDRAASANSIERDKLALQRDELTANIDRIDKQLTFEEKKLKTESGLKSRQLNIEQAGKLGTGPLAAQSGLGTPGGFNLQKLAQAYISSRGADMKPEEFLGLSRLILSGGMNPVSASPTPQGPAIPQGGINSQQPPLLPPGITPQPTIFERNFAPADPNFGESGTFPAERYLPPSPSISMEGLLSHLFPDSTKAKPIKTLKAH